MRSWLFSVARYTVADRYRLQARTPRAESFPPLEDPRSLAKNGRFDEYLALWSLLDQLLPDRRRAFVLTQVEGLPYAEAAELLKVPVGTVRSRVARARQHLIEMLRAAE
ncbi:RNA polymerase sigma factor [Nocardiopsis sp. NPDC055551]